MIVRSPCRSARRVWGTPLVPAANLVELEHAIGPFQITVFCQSAKASWKPWSEIRADVGPIQRRDRVHRGG